MIHAHNIVADLLSCTLQENLTMDLELVYSDDERRVAQSTSKQIWDILYKDTIALDIRQTEGGEDDLPKGRNPGDNDNTDDTTDSSDSGRSEREDIVNETSPGGRDTGYDERDSQDEVVEDTSAVGTED